MSLRRRVGVVDYFAGNLFSVCKAFEHFGCDIRVASEPGELAGADCVVLPGVGAFGDGMATLRQRGLVEAMLAHVEAGRPLLGICLGMQLLMDRSEELGDHEGLGLIAGDVRRLPDGAGMKVPHVGWNRLMPPESRGREVWAGTILEAVPEGRDVYFVHSFVACPADERDVLSRTPFGTHRFCSAVHKDNVWGCQFHPEKSGPAGLAIIGAFLGS